MRIRFLGTRGEIEASSELHRRHSSLLVGFRGREVMVDCGLDWRSELDEIRAGAVVLTHAHPDHAGGLRDGVSCPVFALEETWTAIRRYPIEERSTVQPRRQFQVLGIRFVAFPVEHSLRAPAVGYRIEAGRAVLFYVPDVVSIGDEREALAGIDLYVGDGAAITRSIVRYRDGRAIGHTSIRAQLEWCARASVGRAVFTHCGSEIVKGDSRSVAARVAELGAAQGVDALVAYDGLELTLP